MSHAEEVVQTDAGFSSVAQLRFALKNGMQVSPRKSNGAGTVSLRVND